MTKAKTPPTRTAQVARNRATAEYLPVPAEARAPDPRGKLDEKVDLRVRKAQTFARLALNRNLTHGAVRLFLVLYTFADAETGRCWPGQRKLRGLLGSATDSLKPWLEALNAEGFISMEMASTAKGLKTIYTLHFDGGVPETRNTLPSPDPGLSPGVPAFGPGDPETRNETNTNEPNSTEPNTTKQNTTLSCGFFRNEGDPEPEPKQRQVVQPNFNVVWSTLFKLGASNDLNMRLADGLSRDGYPGLHNQTASEIEAHLAQLLHNET